MKDLIIIGAGPAGLTAAIYAARGGLDFLVIESAECGGQITSTYEVDNYPGFKSVTGMYLANQMKEHAESLGCQMISGIVVGIEDNGNYKTIICHRDKYEAKAVIIATGAKHAVLGVPGEEELSGAGVSYCATCDGAFYKDAVVAVAGGGNVAIEDAIYLARTCEKVYLIHRRDKLRAEKALQEKLFKLDNVEVLWNTNIVAVKGEDEGEVNGVEIFNISTREKDFLELDGVFVAVGTVPDTSYLNGLIEMDEKGYIVAGEDCSTNVPGIYCAGDVRRKALRQIVTAVADGANAVHSVMAYVK